MMRYLYLILFFIVMVSCEISRPNEFYDIPGPHELNLIPADALNSLTPEKVAFGKHMFNDKSISPDGRTACSNCHRESDGHTPDISIPGGCGVGCVIVDGKYIYDPHYVGIIDTMPRILAHSWQGSAFQTMGGASGRFALNAGNTDILGDIYNHFNMQDSFPPCGNTLFQASRALGGHELLWRINFMQSPESIAMLLHAFPEVNMDSITNEDLKFKISCGLDAFQRVEGQRDPYNSKFQRVMEGTESFTIAEAAGYTLFQTRCTSCHDTPMMSSSTPQKSFMSDNGWAPNHRAQITGNVPDTINYYRMARALRGNMDKELFGYDGRYLGVEAYMVDKLSWLDTMSMMAKIDTKINGGITLREKNNLMAFLKTLETDKE